MWHWGVCVALEAPVEKSLQRMANIGRPITDCSRFLVKSKFAREQTEDSAGAEGARISRLTSRIGVEWSDNGREIDTRERGSIRANQLCRRILCNRPRASNYLICPVNEQKRRSQISIGLIRAIVRKGRNGTVKLISTTDIFRNCCKSDTFRIDRADVSWQCFQLLQSDV